MNYSLTCPSQRSNFKSLFNRSDCLQFISFSCLIWSQRLFFMFPSVFEAPPRWSYLSYLVDTLKDINFATKPLPFKVQTNQNSPPNELDRWCVQTKTLRKTKFEIIRKKCASDAARFLRKDFRTDTDFVGEFASNKRL